MCEGVCPEVHDMEWGRTGGRGLTAKDAENARGGKKCPSGLCESPLRVCTSPGFVDTHFPWFRGHTLPLVSWTHTSPGFVDIEDTEEAQRRHGKGTEKGTENCGLAA